MNKTNGGTKADGFEGKGKGKGRKEGTKDGGEEDNRNGIEEGGKEEKEGKEGKRKKGGGPVVIRCFKVINSGHDRSDLFTVCKRW
jgi:hypothetical protein